MTTPSSPIELVENADIQCGPNGHGGFRVAVHFATPEEAEAFHVSLFSPPIQSGWRDIASAPKDQPIVLAYFGIDRAHDGAAAVSHLFQWDGMPKALAGGWSWRVDPTHWMPLPPPPGSFIPGKGLEDSTGEKSAVCQYCDGKGFQLNHFRDEGGGLQPYEVPCSSCEGTGVRALQSPSDTPEGER